MLVFACPFFALRLTLGLRHLLIARVIATADELFLLVRETPVDRFPSGGAQSRRRLRGPVIPELLQASGLLGFGSNGRHKSMKRANRSLDAPNAWFDGDLVENAGKARRRVLGLFVAM